MESVTAIGTEALSSAAKAAETGAVEQISAATPGQEANLPDPSLVSQFEGIFNTTPPMHAVSTEANASVSETSKVVTEKWVDGLQEVNDKATSLTESIEMLADGKELSAHDLIKLQMEVHKVTMASELSAKSAGKLSDGTKTLLQNNL